MRMLSTNRILRLLLLAAPVLALAVAALVLAFGPGSGNKAQADFPHPGLNFSIGIGSSCDSGGSATCETTAGQVVTVDFKLNTLPGDLTYDGYDATLNFTGLTVDASPASLVQTGAGVWPSCAFPASFTVPGQLAAGCARGIGGTPSSYTGVLFRVNFTCPSPAPASPATITLPAGAGNTSLTDPDSVSHGESVDETLTVTCGAPVVGPTTPPSPTTPPTNTPAGPSATPTNTSVPTTPATNTPVTPTRTPLPPTATRTRTPTPEISQGDVNGDGRIDSTDALWILWKEAGIVDQVPLPENSDVDKDGQTNSIDALFILWIAGGRIPAP